MKRPKPGPRLQSRAWARLRRAILARDGHACQRCGRHAPLEVHHRDGNPGNNDAGNLETICRPCHLAEHAPPVTPEVAAWHDLVRMTAQRRPGP